MGFITLGLDPPLLLYFPRLVWRTFLRLFRLRAPCASGCLDQPSETFCSRNSIFWWALTQHSVVRRKAYKKIADDGVHKGGKVRRIGGWGSQLERWIADVREMIEGS